MTLMAFKVPEKQTFKIGEVCEMLQLEPYVLRYWESEFDDLSPKKNAMGQRIYRPRDIEIIYLIKKLLYEEGYTILGARKQLKREISKLDGGDASMDREEMIQGAFERALKVKPDFAEASNGLGALLAQGGDLSGAVARFRLALDATPDYPDALNNLGYALLQSGRPRDAYELYQKALKLQPDFPEAFNNLGIYFAKDGDLVQAESHFKQALQRRPSYGEAGNNFALVLMARDDAAGAVGVLQRLLEANPDFEMTYVTLAKIHLATGRRREGVQVLERLLQKNPRNPLALQMMQEAGGAR